MEVWADRRRSVAQAALRTVPVAGRHTVRAGVLAGELHTGQGEARRNHAVEADTGRVEHHTAAAAGAGSPGEHRTAAAGEGNRERRTAGEEGNLGAGSRPGEGIGDATLMVAVVVVDCSLVEDKASMTGLVGADCSQAEGSRAGGMVAVVRQAVVAGSTTCLVIY